MSVCVKCKKVDVELRGSICFDCATKGEAGLAGRKVYQHVLSAWKNAWRGHKHLWKSKIDLQCAFERLTKTGDYSTRGVFTRINCERTI